VTVLEFDQDLWLQKTRVPGYHAVLLRDPSLAVFVELRLVPEGQTDRQTDGHRATAYSEFYVAYTYPNFDILPNENVCARTPCVKPWFHVKMKI